MAYPEDNIKKSGKNTGRPKGAKGKIAEGVKQCFLAVFEQRGGVPALLAWSNENPDEFYRLVGKLLPRQVDVDVSGTIELSSAIEKARKRAVQR